MNGHQQFYGVGLVPQHALSRGPLNELGRPHNLQSDVARWLKSEIVFGVVVRTEEDQVVGAVIQGLGDSLDVRHFAIVRIPADRGDVMELRLDIRLDDIRDRRTLPVRVLPWFTQPILVREQIPSSKNGLGLGLPPFLA